MILPEQLPMVHTATMNDTHFDAMLLINKLSTALESGDMDSINKSFSELIEHTEQHCKHEEEMMVEKKFPPYLAHKEEHDLALGDMHKEAAKFKETSDVQSAKKYIEVNLEPWFMQHTETMDAVTSIFLENSEAHLPYWERLVPRKK